MSMWNEIVLKLTGKANVKPAMDQARRDIQGKGFQAKDLLKMDGIGAILRGGLIGVAAKIGWDLGEKIADGLQSQEGLFRNTWNKFLNIFTMKDKIAAELKAAQEETDKALTAGEQRRVQNTSAGMGADAAAAARANALREAERRAGTTGGTDVERANAESANALDKLNSEIDARNALESQLAVERKRLRDLQAGGNKEQTQVVADQVAKLQEAFDIRKNSAEIALQDLMAANARGRMAQEAALIEESAAKQRANSEQLLALQHGNERDAEQAAAQRKLELEGQITEERKAQRAEAEKERALAEQLAIIRGKIPGLVGRVNDPSAGRAQQDAEQKQARGIGKAADEFDRNIERRVKQGQTYDQAFWAMRNTRGFRAWEAREAQKQAELLQKQANEAQKKSAEHLAVIEKRLEMPNQ